MNPIRIFISSVQKELAEERMVLRDYLQGDPLLRRFFEVFLFEDMPAADQRADQCYLSEVKKCDIYLGIFGNEYGWEDKKDGLSPTHKEYNLASKLEKQRLIYVKGADDKARHPKMKALVRKIGDDLIRRRFNSCEELRTSVYASLVRVLEERELICFSPFDASYCRDATMNDLDNDRITEFLGLARRGRSFPLPGNSSPKKVLTHLNLLNKGRPTHAAILLFGKKPQRFLLTSEVKCAHFHGTTVCKPIPSYQVYKGTVFELVEQAKDFVLSKINLWVGTREKSAQVPVQYEFPQEVVTEAIVNAIAHRDYTSNASVQVMLFADRLEIWNPGALPPPLTLKKIRKPHASIPGNPLIAEALYLTKYIERMGTGIIDMITRCKDAGIPEPEIRIDGGCFILTLRRIVKKTQSGTKDDKIGVPVEVPVGVQEGGQEFGNTDLLILTALSKNVFSSIELTMAIGYSQRTRNYRTSLNKLLVLGYIEMTIPKSPRSKNQKYRITIKGREYLKTRN
ncbi:MAG: DUF4062 domain-containing protein [Planctomycetia bacterium]|nr:DUF4062 domain-containing protein [Planctomycetia bacterium]